jgi:hypothetical protein
MCGRTNSPCFFSAKHTQPGQADAMIGNLPTPSLSPLNRAMNSRRLIYKAQTKPTISRQKNKQFSSKKADSERPLCMPMVHAPNKPADEIIVVIV